MCVYRVQNGRSADLAKVLNAAFGNGASESRMEEDGAQSRSAAERAPEETRRETPLTPETPGDRSNENRGPSDYALNVRISRDETSTADRTRVVKGKSVSVRVDLGGRRNITQNQQHRHTRKKQTNKKS